MKVGETVSRIRPAFLFVVMIVVPSVVLASWTGMGDVSQVYSHNGTYFINSSISENPCGQAGKFFWRTTDEDAKDMYAMALTALVANKQVRVSGNFGSPSCLYGGAEIGYMMIAD